MGRTHVELPVYGQLGTEAVFQRLWARLATKIRMGTAWHAQSDGQSERTNQEVEIALRTAADDDRYCDWEDALPSVIRTHNSSPTATGKSPNEILYGFQLFALLPPAKSNLPEERLINRLDASDALAYAEVVMTERYNAKHTQWQPAVGDLVYV